MVDCKRFILWGSAGHAKVLAELIGLRRGRIVALFDNNAEALPCLPNVPLFHGARGFQQWLEEQGSLEGICAALAIGGTRGKDRQELVPRPSCQNQLDWGKAARYLPTQWWQRTF